MSAPSRLERRKDEHLDLCLEQDVEAQQVTPGFDRYRLPHRALPDLDLAAVDLGAELAGRPLRMPLVITGMTGGSTRAGEVNQALARVAQRTGVGLGLGSQRAMIEHPELAWSYQVREQAPDVPILANLGAVQLNRGVTPAQCAEVVQAVDADVLCLHLNALQEAIQPEGDRDFRGLDDPIRAVVEAVSVPVLLKETGCGISGETATRAAALGCAGVDLSGVGGTSWSRVEALRQQDPLFRAVGEAHRDWGIPTVESLIEVRAAIPRHLVIASGGVRSGTQMAIALALGADLCGVALPVLRALAESEDAAVALLDRYREELRVALFCCGAADPDAMRAVELRPAGGPEHA